MGMHNPLTMAVGIQELWPIALIIVVLFGAKKIPELARGLGSGLKEFKKAMREGDEDQEPKDDKSAADSSKSA
jgi:sec-independent protein translocase protein TatA